MPRDPFVREKFTKNLNAARKHAAEYFERFPKDRYQTEVESWRNLQSDNIEFTMRRLREPIEGGVNVELTETEIVILRGLDAKPALDIPGVSSVAGALGAWRTRLLLLGLTVVSRAASRPTATGFAIHLAGICR
jgi:hypothetical protein